MPMSSLNRSNPFVMLMEDTYHDIDIGLVSLLKFVIITGIVVLIMITGTSIIFGNFVPILYYLLTVIIDIIVLRNVLKSNIDLGYIRELVNGEDYSSSNVNNEKILKVICRLKVMEGNVELLQLIAKINFIIITITSALLLFAKF